MWTKQILGCKKVIQNLKVALNFLVFSMNRKNIPRKILSNFKSNSETYTKSSGVLGE